MKTKEILDKIETINRAAKKIQRLSNKQKIIFEELAEEIGFKKQSDIDWLFDYCYNDCDGFSLVEIKKILSK